MTRSPKLSTRGGLAKRPPYVIRTTPEQKVREVRRLLAWAERNTGGPLDERSIRMF